MKSAKPGNDILKAEVLNVSPHDFWLLVEEQKYFLGFDAFPGSGRRRQGASRRARRGRL